MGSTRTCLLPLLEIQPQPQGHYLGTLQAPGTVPGDTPRPGDSAWGTSKPRGQCLGMLRPSGTLPGDPPSPGDSAWGCSKPQGHCLGIVQALGTLRCPKLGRRATSSSDGDGFPTQLCI